MDGHTSSFRSIASSTDCSASARDDTVCKIHPHLIFTVVVLGASGDLAKKKTFPALFTLYARKFLPKNTRILGYARSSLTAQDLRERLKKFLKGEAGDVEAFLELVDYIEGQYDGDEGYQNLEKALAGRESQHEGKPCGRLFYLALPPTVYPQVCTGINKNCSTIDTSQEGSWLRLVVEKPFGRDLASSEELAEQIGSLFPEEQIYRIDHYLGKEIMQNMLVMRFANTFIGPMWNRLYVDNVQISFKEPFGTQGRGGYFDTYGIIRDVIQNHLTQVLALVAMEEPVTMNADDIRDEKVKVLRCIRPVAIKDTVIGQYTAANGEEGYLDDPGVPKDSKTPTFAAVVLHIHNVRWAGVPFVLKAGKALNERKAEIRVQFKSHVASMVPEPHKFRNEFVMRIQPDEAIYLKMVVKKPGLAVEPVMSEMDLSYSQRYSGTFIPDAYERLILDAIRGDQQHFVRRDELRAAWAIFTPLLHAIDRGELEPLPYPAGSRGPPAADMLISNAGFIKNVAYEWTPAPLAKNKL